MAVIVISALVITTILNVTFSAYQSEHDHDWELTGLTRIVHAITVEVCYSIESILLLRFSVVKKSQFFSVELYGELGLSSLHFVNT